MQTKDTLKKIAKSWRSYLKKNDFVKTSKGTFIGDIEWRYEKDNMLSFGEKRNKTVVIIILSGWRVLFDISKYDDKQKRRSSEYWTDLVTEKLTYDMDNEYHQLILDEIRLVTNDTINNAILNDK